jgi:purine-binding chemotaxis protein CheW
MTPDKDKTRSGSIQLSTFYLGDAQFGIDTLRVQEIIKVNQITTVYHAPDYALGVVNLRGRIVTIIDLGTKIGLAPSRCDETSRIVIVDSGAEYIGLLVDRIGDVIMAEWSEVAEPPSNVKGVQGRFMRGIYKKDHLLVAILDADQVLVEEE